MFLSLKRRSTESPPSGLSSKRVPETFQNSNNLSSTSISGTNLLLSDGQYWRQFWPYLPQPGAMVWLRHAGVFYCGHLISCMPELNMFSVRPNDGSQRLFTRGIEDILPADAHPFAVLPSTDDVDMPSAAVCYEPELDCLATPRPSCAPHEKVPCNSSLASSLTSSYSFPLYIDAGLSRWVWLIIPMENKCLCHWDKWQIMQ